MKKSIKRVLNFCQLLVVFESQNKLCNEVHFKDPVPQILTSGVAYKFQSGFCNESCYGECVRQLTAKNGKHTGISPLTNKSAQPRKDTVACHHLSNYNYSPSFGDFGILCNEDK